MKETKFKQTEVGMIPSDWEVLPIKGLCTKVTDGSHESPKEVDNGYYMPSVKDMTDLGFCFSDCKQISKNDYLKLERNGCRPEKDDVLIAKDGSILKYAFVMDDELPIVILSSIAILRPNKKKIDSHYFAHYFKKEDFVNKVLSDYKTGTGVPRIVLNNFKEIEIAYPKKIEEQQRIANALSDVDTLIANLEKLIAKKKNIKQGAMQQLLTGKKRLPGFGSDKRQKECHSERSTKREVEESSGYKMTELGMIPSDWEVKTISQVGKIIGGGTPSTFNSAYWNGSVQWFTPAELSKAGKYVSKSERTITKLGVENCSAKILPAGTILLTTRASIGTSAILKAPACTNQGFQSLVVNSENSNEFLYYLLSTKVDEMMSLASGSTFLEISPKKLGGIQLQIPSSRAEQAAIANVLSDMDTEIATLETKLAKYRKLKTGMMQQLLTGKIRLV